MPEEMEIEARILMDGYRKTNDPNRYYMSLLYYCKALKKQGKDYQKQIVLLKDYRKYVIKYHDLDRGDFMDEVAITQLAETYYDYGDTANADLMASEFQQKMKQRQPCDERIIEAVYKSWLAWYNARRAFDQGDMDTALEEINTAIALSIKYPGRTESQGLYMREHYELKTKILRIMGIESAAEYSEKQVREIDAHFVKLREMTRQVMAEHGIKPDVKPAEESTIASSPQTVPQ